MSKNKSFSKSSQYKQNRTEKRIEKEVLYGRNACLGCISGYQNKTQTREIYNIYLLQNKWDEYYKQIPNELKSLVHKVNNQEMFHITHEQDKHQGIALSVSKYQFLSLDELLNILTAQSHNAKQKTSIFILDRVQDPHNVGNIIRSMFCFDVDALILPERDGCGITSAVVRTSAGYSEQSLICQVGNLNQTIEKLKQNGFWIIGFDVNETTQDGLREVVKKYDKCCFVFGAEGDGIRELTKKNCDVLIKLPMKQGAESLNVANTASIVGWEWLNAKMN